MNSENFMREHSTLTESDQTPSQSVISLLDKFIETIQKLYKLLKLSK